MLSYDFQLLIISYVNIKFNLNQCKYHGHEKKDDNLSLHIQVNNG